MKKQIDWEQRRYEIAKELIRDLLSKTPDKFMLSRETKHDLEWAMAQANAITYLMKEAFERCGEI
jgi:RAB protein geranylgeranyltransferase component A